MIIIDDSKSRNRLSDKFLSEVLSECKLTRFKLVNRQIQADDYGVNTYYGTSKGRYPNGSTV